MNIAELKAIDVHVHIEHTGEDSAADAAARRYFGESGAARDRNALADYYRSQLSTGTWVSVGPLRAAFLTYCAGAAQEVVLAAPDRDYVGALIFAASGVTAETLRPLIESFARRATGISTRVQRAILLDGPPSMDSGELTEKGTVNQKAVLRNRASVVEELYAGSPRVIEIRT